MQKPLRVVIFREQDRWVAQCLEHDLCTQAADLTTLQRRLRATVHLENDRDLDRLPAAPARFFAMWEERAATFDSTMTSDGVAYDLALVA